MSIGAITKWLALFLIAARLHAMLMTVKCCKDPDGVNTAFSPELLGSIAAEQQG